MCTANVKSNNHVTIPSIEKISKSATDVNVLLDEQIISYFFKRMQR
jgi:hypothetical protein